MQEYKEMLESKFEKLSALDWEDVSEFGGYTQAMLRDIAQDKDLLTYLLHSVLDDSALLALCECNPVLSRIVVYNHEGNGIRLRFHLFSTEVEDKPHNHRWSFSSIILHGGYKHLIYAVNTEINEALHMKNLMPVLEREESAGSAYSLHHSAVHTTIVRPDTVSLILRGPVRKDRWLNVDRRSDKARWHSGKDKEQKIMTKGEYEQLLADLVRLHVCNELPLRT